jgi:hypothetical protein
MRERIWGSEEAWVMGWHFPLPNPAVVRRGNYSRRYRIWAEERQEQGHGEAKSVLRLQASLCSSKGHTVRRLPVRCFLHCKSVFIYIKLWKTHSHILPTLLCLA